MSSAEQLRTVLPLKDSEQALASLRQTASLKVPLNGHYLAALVGRIVPDWVVLEVERL